MIHEVYLRIPSFKVITKKRIESNFSRNESELNDVECTVFFRIKLHQIPKNQNKCGNRDFFNFLIDDLKVKEILGLLVVKKPQENHFQ
jgi:hypothetical protein